MTRLGVAAATQRLPDRLGVGLIFSLPCSFMRSRPSSDTTLIPSMRDRYGKRSCQVRPDAEFMTSTVNSSLMRIA